MKISKVFYDFCKDYLEAAEKGESSKSISLYFGLCHNLLNNDIDPNILKDYIKPKHLHPFTKTPDFEEDDYFPFNKGIEEYYEESHKGIVHKNKYRLAFVKHIVEIYEKN